MAVAWNSTAAAEKAQERFQHLTEDIAQYMEIQIPTVAVGWKCSFQYAHLQFIEPILA